ncbi:hypothetical protein [Myxococcus landrumensis]|uniref:Lipoprotein n=1 Tax=Myxococcus landrumensis TaxID=2813577 RepID=A0ABX7N9D0_9BACT|nr:hypothetical protein [Myxococcus landrumus]QSQ15028.1 hypothetical protein JY572_02780 [Myxococcus landrumus]
MHGWVSGVMLVLVSAAGGARAEEAGEVSHKVELVLDCGFLAGSERLSVVVSAPKSVAQGLSYTLTFQNGEGVVPKNRGPIKVYDIHDIELTLGFPPAARLVPGSLTLEGGTNVGETSAFIDAQQNQLTYVLATKGTRILAGMRYTPPRVRWQVRNEAPPGAELPVRIERIAITSRSSLGTKRVVCSPEEEDSVLARTRSVATAR